MSSEFMSSEFTEIVIRLVLALAVGSVIGLERTFSGRPAGFRTHALVCVAASLLMLASAFQHLWLMLPPESVRTDPTRMAQGIMTGIGFLGAGVIFKEGVSIRGLTTAASIWMTTAIGTLIGIGFYFPALLAAALTFGVLSTFRLIESRFPARRYARLTLRFKRPDVLSQEEVRQILRRYHFRAIKTHYHLRDGDSVEYRLLIKTIDPRNVEHLYGHLLTVTSLREFSLGLMAN